MPATTLTPQRQQLQALLLADDTGPLQASLKQQLIVGYQERNKNALPDGTAAKAIDRAAIVMADAAHKKVSELNTAGTLKDLENDAFAKTILIAAHDGLDADPQMVDYKNMAAGYAAKMFNSYDPDLFYTLTGCKDGNIDPNSQACTALLEMFGSPAANPSRGHTPSAEEQRDVPPVDLSQIDFSQMFGNLYAMHSVLEKIPDAAGALMTIPPEEMAGFAPVLANTILEKATKYNLDVQPEQAHKAATIVATQFALWANHYKASIDETLKKDRRPLNYSEMNQLLSVLASNTRAELKRNSAELGPLGSDDAINFVIGTGHRDDYGVNVTNIGQMVLTEYRGDALTVAMADKKAIDALTSSGKLKDDNIYAGINSLPPAIRSNDGYTLQITDTTKNFLTNAADKAKKDSYDEGWGASIWRILQAICAFVSSLVCNWDFSKAAADAAHVFDSSNIEHGNRAKFAANYAQIVERASATELGFSGNPALLPDYKRYLLTTSLTRMNESAAGLSSPNAAPEFTKTTTDTSTSYYPGIDPKALLAGDPNHEAQDAWLKYSEKDSDKSPIYIFRKDNKPLAVETLSAATDGSGKYQIDPAIRDQVMDAAKQAAQQGKVLVAVDDRNGNNVIDADEFSALPAAAVKGMGPGVEIAPKR